MRVCGGLGEMCSIMMHRFFGFFRLFYKPTLASDISARTTQRTTYGTKTLQAWRVLHCVHRASSATVGAVWDTSTPDCRLPCGRCVCFGRYLWCDGHKCLWCLAGLGRCSLRLPCAMRRPCLANFVRLTMVRNRAIAVVVERDGGTAAELFS